MHVTSQKKKRRKHFFFAERDILSRKNVVPRLITYFKRRRQGKRGGWGCPVSPPYFDENFSLFCEKAVKQPGCGKPKQVARRLVGDRGDNYCSFGNEAFVFPLCSFALKKRCIFPQFQTCFSCVFLKKKYSFSAWIWRLYPILRFLSYYWLCGTVMARRTHLIFPRFTPSRAFKHHP